MIATKKAKLIRKHLGSNTPEWVVKNCIELLKEYEEIEWCGVPEKQANDVQTGDDKCHIQRVSNSALHENKKLVENMCISYRHDFGLLMTAERNQIRRECEEWLRAYDNNREHCC